MYSPQSFSPSVFLEISPFRRSDFINYTPIYLLQQREDKKMCTFYKFLCENIIFLRNEAFINDSKKTELSFKNSICSVYGHVAIGLKSLYSTCRKKRFIVRPHPTCFALTHVKVFLQFAAGSPANGEQLVVSLGAAFI